jgi:Zn-dependent protease with chaperone function
MFSNLIFLLLVLLTSTMSTSLPVPSFLLSTWKGFFLGLCLYAALLGIIYWQKKTFNKMGKWSHSGLFLTQVELLIFLILFFFVFGAHRLFTELPVLGTFQIIPTLFSLALYFGGLAVFHTAGRSKGTTDQTFMHRFLFIVPFALPFLLFTLIVDLLYLPVHQLAPYLLEQFNTPLGTLIFFGMSLIFVGLSLMFLPPLIVWIWGCKPIEEGPLKDRLDQLCQRAHFTHAGFRTWTVMSHALTAAILGVLPRLRYVIFTPALLKELPPDEIEAILAHEIGHCYYKHLWRFPLVIFGLVICTALFIDIFIDPISGVFDLLSQRYPSPIWSLLYPLAIFLPILLIFILYLRYVFGLFSRLFERQADLHGFNLGVPSEHMIGALDSIAVATGFTHLVPNWHHYSIQERMDFLKKMKQHPKLISRYHKHVRRYFIGYLMILGLGIVCAISPLLAEISPFKQIAKGMQTLSTRLNPLTKETS